MDNRAAGLGALEYGSLTGIQTDVYLAAVWARAVQAMAYLAKVLGDPEVARDAEKREVQLNQAFDRLFWNTRTRQYAYAFDSDGRLVDEVTPWCAVAALWGLGTPERRQTSLRRIARADVTTDWGVRMLSAESPRYEPLNYNYGAAWPFLTGWVATADFRNGLVQAGVQNLRSTVALVYENALGHVNEVLSGATHIWPEASVPHQGFSTTGYVLPVLWGLLGLEADAPAGRLTFAPALPATWPKVRIRNLRVGKARLDLSLQRQRDLLRLVVEERGTGRLQLQFAPVLGPGVKVQQVKVNGNSLNVRVRTTPRLTQPLVGFELTGQNTVEIVFQPAPEVVPPRTTSQLGERPHEVRFLDVYRQGNTLVVRLEGRSGTFALIPVSNADLVKRVEGGNLSGNTLHVLFPATGEGFVEKTVRLVVGE